MSITERLIKVLESGRDDALVRFGLGSAYFNEKHFEQSVPHLEQCLIFDENYSAAYKLLGRAYIKLDKLELARDVLKRGLAVAINQGDKQTEKEILVFLKKAG